MDLRTLNGISFATSICLSTVAHAEVADEPKLLPISAEQPCRGDASRESSGLRRGVAVAAAVVPGVVVHGAGHWVNAQPCAARRLAVAEAIGVGGILAGGSTIIFSGASRYLMLPAISLTIAGFGLFVTSFAADIYGASGAAKSAGEPLVWRPRWESEVGILRVHNPLFDFEWLLAQQLAVNVQMLRVSAALDTAVDASHGRYRLGASVRGFGPRVDSAARDGSHFDLYLGLTEQRYALSGFISDSAELLATGRLDLARIGPSLRGAFAELSTGVAFARTRYVIDGLSVPADLESLLLGRIAFGAYLGRDAHRGSEAMLYYDHRHDDYAAGLKIPGLGSGTIGHWGLSFRYFFARQWGLGSTFEVGSAYVTGFSLLFRDGGKL